MSNDPLKEGGRILEPTTSIRVLVSCIALSIAGAALAESEVTLVAWSIANLHHEAGVEARPGIGTKRQEGDFARLSNIAGALSADIVALQEVATPEGAERLFPSDEFAIFVSSRYTEDIEDGVDGGIYTAIAVRKEVGITVVGQNDLMRTTCSGLADHEASG